MKIKEGEFTAAIYGAIKDQKYKEAVNMLNQQLLVHPSSRAALSLLGYCFYQLQDFVSASDCYEQLTQHFPDIEEYKFYFAQSLYKADLFQAATKAAAQIEDPNFKEKLNKLNAAIHYGEGDLSGSRSIMTGFQPQLSYNIALCYYHMKQYAQSLKYIADVIEHGIRDHPELGVGMTTEGLEVRSVGNTLTLHETALIETFNLKAAIEFNLKNYTSASEALTDMPPRNEDELDHITLHNQAVMNMNKEPGIGFQKLQFLLQQETFPSETFANLLLLYIKYEYYDLAADVLAENATLAYEYLSSDLFDFIEAVILRQTAPQDAYNQNEYAEELMRKIEKEEEELEQQQQQQHQEVVLEGVEIDPLNHHYSNKKCYHLCIINLVIGTLYCTKGNYDFGISRIMKSLEPYQKKLGPDTCWCYDDADDDVDDDVDADDNKDDSDDDDLDNDDDDDDKMKLLVITLITEDLPYHQSIYNQILKLLFFLKKMMYNRKTNLCVTYIMTSQNEYAEELMRKIEKEEEELEQQQQQQHQEVVLEGVEIDPLNHHYSNKKCYHLCIINLVIGTLYCTKGNYDFGISRIMKSLEPYQKKLGPDTWYYAKRCFLSLIENMSKHMILLRDAVLMECIQFLEHCEYDDDDDEEEEEEDFIVQLYDLG
ncbi:tetratricopeptide repeat protein 30 [Schistosoma bovis]|uniref:Tetratricopeptide repeat protein 30 n=1 Tax=Schistosoma bovis TaxID=6184 RepID=A0A430Q7L1_SCHBO|nr:tetratricopeptide repeat protein 30 [Schistosoma bovis]